MAIRYPREGNPLYPLPPNYHRLSPEEQKAARLNALELQETPEDVVIAWAFFRWHYLRPKECRWYKRYRESPPLHYKMIEDLAGHQLNAWAAPRGFAKSTVMREIAIMYALTRPDFVVSIVQATDRKARASLRIIMRCLERNPRILEDFGVLKPPRGARPWSTEGLELPNGSVISCGSIRGALRGDRPDMILVDDPEYDEDLDQDQSGLLDDFETLLFQTIIPMLEEGTALFWIGTMISRRSYLWAIVEGDDPRFKFFHRRNIGIVMPDGTKAWEAKWDDKRINELRAMLGEAAFNSEYMNMPGSGAERILKIHPELCTYRVEGGSPEKEDHPLQSSATLVYAEGYKQENGQVRCIEQRRPFGEWASNLYRIICVDHARKVKRTADDSCVVVMGFDQDDTLWVLDIFLGKVSRETLTRVVFDMAMRWGVRVIGSESISIEEETTNQMAALLSQMAAGTGWIPKVVPIKYARSDIRRPVAPNQRSKSDRIAGLEWRFNSYRIKYPAHRKHEPAVYQLFFQTEQFTMDLSLLRHDDAIDTVAMHQHLVRRKGTAGTRKVARLKNATDMLRSGELFDEALGIPVLDAVGFDRLSIEDLNMLMDRKYAEAGFDSEQQEIDDFYELVRGGAYQWN